MDGDSAQAEYERCEDVEREPCLPAVHESASPPAALDPEVNEGSERDRRRKGQQPPPGEAGRERKCRGGDEDDVQIEEAALCEREVYCPPPPRRRMCSRMPSCPRRMAQRWLA